MKRLALLLVMFFIIALSTSDARPRYGGVDFNFFYGSLSPHGNWIEIDAGLYGWRPYSVSHNWRPYSMGRWVWTSYGWYWDSYEPYGWAVYHYGRWYFDDYYGWMWIPDYEWGPSWVEWRYDDDYIGWAPLPPYAVHRAGFGIHFTFDWHFPYHHWNYVSVRHFCSDDGYRHYVPDKVKYRVHSRARHNNDYDYRDGRIINRGIDRNFVERRTRVKVVERSVTETTRLRDNSGQRNNRNRDRVEVYRPDDNEISRHRSTNRVEAKRIDRKSTLKVDRVEIGERSRERRDNSSRSSSDINPRSERVERVTPNTQREQVERRNDDAWKIQPVPKPENPGRDRDRRNSEDDRRVVTPQERKVVTPREEERRVVTPQPEERRVVTPQPQERRTVEPRQSEEPRREQVRERRTEETRSAAPKPERRETERKESGGGRERSRDRK